MTGVRMFGYNRLFERALRKFARVEKIMKSRHKHMRNVLLQAHAIHTVSLPRCSED